MENALYIGLMSGSSLDGVDAVLVDLSGPFPELIASHYRPLPQTITEEISRLSHVGKDELNRAAMLDRHLGHLFADTVLELLSKSGIPAAGVSAIGSHGQTLRHAPDNEQAPYTLQVGDAYTIALKTGITTVADFRRADIAAGGQGAPLVPAFHAALFQDSQVHRTLVNIGGMANLSILPAKQSNQPISGFDTGPGNVLLDTWIQLNQNKSYDSDGLWAASGTCNQELLTHMLRDSFFHKPPPKSTGRELFSLPWLERQLLRYNELPPEDIQATLLQLTAVSIEQAVTQYAPKTQELIVCGGGAYNKELLKQLDRLSNQWEVSTTQDFNMAPEWVEAIAFAWLAQQRLANKPANCPVVTGASQAVTLGCVYSPAKSSISE